MRKDESNLGNDAAGEWKERSVTGEYIGAESEQNPVRKVIKQRFVDCASSIQNRSTEVREERKIGGERVARMGPESKHR